MTATRIRETADGVLYRLSEPVEYEYCDFGGVFKTKYVEVWYDDSMWGETCVHASDEQGRTDMATYMLHGSPNRTDPDAMIEAMGYTVIREEL